MKRHPVLRIHYRHPEEGWEGIAIIDSLVDGVAAGGVRVLRTADADEVAALGRAMTRKLRALDLPLGGAKYGLRYDPASTTKVDALTDFFRALKPYCESVAGFGPDMNTTAEELDEVARRIGLPSRHTALGGPSESGKRAVAGYHKVLNERFGPIRVLEARTGVGVAAAMEHAAQIYGLPKRLNVALQGFGQVGSGTALFLKEAGHRLVSVADLGGCYTSRDGLDFEQLLASRDSNGQIRAEHLPRGVLVERPDTVFSKECDVLLLAANSFALMRSNVDGVRAQLVVEAGNLAVLPEAEALLHGRGVPVVPDFLANGGAIAVVAGVIRLGWPVDNAKALIDRLGEHIGRVVAKAATSAKSRNLTIRQAALVDMGLHDET